MSDVVRTYKRRTSSRGYGFRSGPRRRPWLWRVLAAMILLSVIAAWWTTRDTRPIYNFVDREAEYQVTAPAYQAARLRVSNSPLWMSLPPDNRWSAIPATLTDRFGMPEWLYRNLTPGALHAWGHDSEELSDLVLISRMSRVGTLVERAQRWLPGRGVEWAGGLNLRVHRPTGWHYSVRGRVLIASRSREALVDALTLAPERQWTREDLDRSIAAGAEDIRGVIHGDADAEWSSIRFAARIGIDEGLGQVEMRLRDSGRRRWADWLNGGAPSVLSAPLDAPAALTANVDNSVANLWLSAGADSSEPLFSRAVWRGWRSGQEGESIAWAARLLESSGPYASVSWYGFDMEARQPAPLLRGRFGLDPRAADALTSELGEAAYDSETWEPLPHAVDGNIMLPLPDWADTPFALRFGEGEAAFETASPVFEFSPGGATWDETAHVLFRYSPGECAELWGEAAQYLADYDLLRGESAEDFARQRQERSMRLSRIEDARVAVTAEPERVSIKLQLIFAGNAR